MIHSFLKSYQAHFIQALEDLDLDQVSRVVDVLYQAYRQKKKIMIAGNGGSASTASHFVCDLSKTAGVPGLPACRALALNDNIPLITAYGNDMGYDYIFSEQVSNLAEPGDVLIGITGSGNSPNILKALTVAREHGVATVGLLGFGGGNALPLCDEAVVLASELYGPIEDIHMYLVHSISHSFKQRLLFDRQSSVVPRETAWTAAAN